MNKKVLIIGSGGREHALAWKLAQSEKVNQVFVAPGNPGTAQIAENMDIASDDFPALIRFAQENRIDLTVVGSDGPLANGIVDAFQAEQLLTFGPTQAAAQIESSKVFAKELMQKYDLPTAEYKSFNEFPLALEYVQSKPVPVVIKASGLALGKGVFICNSYREAEVVLHDLLVEKTLGKAGAEVVIEEYLEGPEISVHAISDGSSSILFPLSQDHKRIGEQNTGPNTGGMGTYAPLDWVPQEAQEDIKQIVVKKALDALNNEVNGFQGCLFPGIILNKTGVKILEYNGRFGDPETQVYMRLLKSDLYDLLEAAATGKLSKIAVEWHSGFAVCVIAASAGYPGEYPKGFPITGIEQAEADSDVVIFQAGTKLDAGQLVTNGGRVLGVTAVGTTLKEAVDLAYAAMGKISFEGKYYRKDIAQSGLRK